MTDLPDRRLLLVHAHPDDESINNGATMARYAAEGAHVTLVTCTRGERGEVIPGELAHLLDDPEQLGAHRLRELAAAMGTLGVTDVRLLGGPGRYRDSGMRGLPDNEDPDCLWQADLDEAAGHLVEVIREVRPQVLVTYDDNGGYGHPDHIQAHRIAMRAVELAADATAFPDANANANANAGAGAAEPWEVAKVYWNRMPRAYAEDAFARLARALPELPFDSAGSIDDVPGVVADERVTAEIDGTAFAVAKAAAMRAHATQIDVCEPWFALSNHLAQPLFTTEFYELVRGERGTGRSAGREHDLFEGVSGA